MIENEKGEKSSVYNELQNFFYFPCSVHVVERPEFLDVVGQVSEEYLEIAHQKNKIDEIYPVYMTDNYFNDSRLDGFCEFIGSTAWDILNNQGYKMENFLTTFTEMWTQEHYKHSSMDAHTHGNGSQIVGFYFLETPDNSSHVVFHDPRAGKTQTDLPESKIENVSLASRMINFKPKPGLMVFTNSWLAHSFTRHAADKPIKFVHFNLTVQLKSEDTFCYSTAEVI